MTAADPADELFHPVGDHPRGARATTSTSSIRDTEVGAFTRMGFRPNDGWADALHAVYLPGGRVAFTYGRRTDLTPAVVDGLGSADPTVGDLTLRRGEPFRRWDIVYAGTAQDMADPTVMLAATKDRPEGWSRPATPRHGRRLRSARRPHYAVGGAQGHFEQTGRVTGTIRLGDDSWDVDGYGVRDKSWGPRTWQAPSGTRGQGGGSRGRRARLLPQLVLDELRRRPGARRGLRPHGRRHVPRQGLDPARR